MESAGNSSVTRKIHYVGARTIQTQCFLDAVNARVSATLHESLDEALSVVCLDGASERVLLIDVTHLPIPRFLEHQTEVAISDRTNTALLNVQRDETALADCLAHGVRGVFFTDNSVDLVLRGLDALLDDAVWIPRDILLDAAVRPMRDHNDPQNGESANELTRREREILGMLCVGATNKEIAAKLFISTNTVKTHIYKIYKKIDVPNRMQAALWGAKNL